MREPFTVVVLVHENCTEPCNCPDAPRVWTCTTCKYEMRQQEKPAHCDVCYYIMSYAQTQIEGATIRVRYTRIIDTHDGYCSDADNFEEQTSTSFKQLPARVDVRQLAGLRWAIDARMHCCCGAQESWSRIEIQERNS